MVERKIYNKGQLVMTRVSGAVKSQELIDHVFWLIDSHNIGEIKSAYDQVIYAEDIESVSIREEDIQRISQISTGLGQSRGKFRTAIIADEAFDIKLAHFYKSLAKDSELEVEICESFSHAFKWLGIDNPEPEIYQ